MLGFDSYFFKDIKVGDFEAYNNITLSGLLAQMCELGKDRGEITLPGNKEELSAIAIGVITGAYISDTIMPDKGHLSVLNSIWKM